MESPKKVLIVEDEKNIVDIVRFNLQRAGYVTEEAVLVAVESRTSAPLRVPRHPETLESLDWPGLYPAGEGAGYAGGIVSAAVDGIRVALAILSRFRG